MLVDHFLSSFPRDKAVVHRTSFIFFLLCLLYDHVHITTLKHPWFGIVFISPGIGDIVIEHHHAAIEGAGRLELTAPVVHLEWVQVCPLHLDRARAI